jgi:type IV pilus assembly protein PilQ
MIAIESIAQAESGKKIYNLASGNPAIGVPLNNIPWQDALTIICNLHGLQQEDKSGAIIISVPVLAKDAIKFKMDTRQVKISAKVLEVKTNATETFGINWSSVVNGAVSYSGELVFGGQSAIGSDLFTTHAETSFDAGENTISIDALMGILEENQDGEVLAKPTICVDSGNKGYIQVGKDFSVKTVDIAGNTTDQFFSTGVILDVTPTIIYDNEGNTAINLAINVERSSAIPGEVSTEITKSKAASSLTVFNGEETTIGGLYDKDETYERGGVPILKDLPGWFFGLRYVFGYKKSSLTEKELVIIIKAEILEPVIERKDKN